MGSWQGGWYEGRGGGQKVGERWADGKENELRGVEGGGQKVLFKKGGGQWKVGVGWGGRGRSEVGVVCEAWAW